MWHAVLFCYIVYTTRAFQDVRPLPPSQLIKKLSKKRSQQKAQAPKALCSRPQDGGPPDKTSGVLNWCESSSPLRGGGVPVRSQ